MPVPAIAALLLVLVPVAAAAAQQAAPAGFDGPFDESFCSSLPAPPGTRLFTKDSNSKESDTLEKCAAICTATPSCVCFDFKPTNRQGCRGVNQVHLKASGDYTAYVNATAKHPPVPPPGPPAPGPPDVAKWSQLWLDYRPVKKRLRSASAQFSQLYCGNTTADGILGNACAELLNGLGGMLGQRLKLVDKVSADGALVLRAGNNSMAWPPNPSAEGFQIGSGRAAPSCLGHSCTLISGPSEVAVLYGVFRYLNLVRRDAYAVIGNAIPSAPLVSAGYYRLLHTPPCKMIVRHTSTVCILQELVCVRVCASSDSVSGIAGTT
jgi:hypothetical protein